MSDEDTSVLSSVAPGAITALLREAFRPSAERGEGPEAFRPGQVVGRFELVRKLGRGGFGVVFEAMDRTLGRAVAFKAVRPVGDVDLREELLIREAEAAAQLSHPNIVTLHDVGQSEHGPYLVMELLRGRTLADRLGAGPLPLAEALRVAIEVAKGVAHAHARGVIHRDLKPGNVFLCEDGHVKVLDLGMARAFGRPKVEGGTGPYMAPEQRRGAPEDERTDVFALGVILHEMLAGERPRRSAAADGGPARLSLAQAPRLADLVARMVASDPGDRPRNGQEALEALGAVAADVAAPGSGAGATPPRPRRTRISVLVAALAAGAVAAVGIAGARGAWRARDAQAEAPPGPAAGAGEPAPAPGPAGPAAVEPERTPGGAAPAPAVHASDAARPGRPAEERPRPAPAVRFCRHGIGAVPTPPAQSGDGVLSVIADPFGALFVRGVARGDTPGECRVAAGTYRIRVVHPHLGAREARLEVRAGERARWAADFVAPAGPAR